MQRKLRFWHRVRFLIGCVLWYFLQDHLDSAFRDLVTTGELDQEVNALQDEISMVDRRVDDLEGRIDDSGL